MKVGASESLRSDTDCIRFISDPRIADVDIVIAGGEILAGSPNPVRCSLLPVLLVKECVYTVGRVVATASVAIEGSVCRAPCVVPYCSRRTGACYRCSPCYSNKLARWSAVFE